MMTKDNRYSADRLSGLSKWKNEVALVTGASSGIGWGVALALGRAGMRGAVTGRRKELLAWIIPPLRSLRPVKTSIVLI